MWQERHPQGGGHRRKCKTETILEVAARTDLFLYDLKLMNPVLHHQWTNAGNDLILHNLKALAETGADIIIRIPLIGGLNDSEENIRQTAEFITGLAGSTKEVHLLPYHNIARHKYAKLGREDVFEKLKEPDKISQVNAIAIFAEYGIRASIGG